MKISPITREQWLKVFKAAVYAFCSGFSAVITLMSLNVIVAAQTPRQAINAGVALLIAAITSGINASVVAIKQLFKQG